MAGLYIVFEGPEGCGKSTQFSLLKKELEKKYPVFATKEPGGTDFGKELREILLYEGAKNFKKKINSIIKQYSSKISKRTGNFLQKALKEQKGKDLSPKIEALLFNADRSYLMDTIIEKKNRNNIVLSDRNYFSTYAYQGAVGGEKLEKLDREVEKATGGLRPDLVVVYRIDPAVGLKRALKETGSRKDRKESKPLSYHKKLAKGYDHIVKREKEKDQSIVVIDADNLNIKQVFDQTKELVLPIFELNYKKINKNK